MDLSDYQVLTEYSHKKLHFKHFEVRDALNIPPYKQHSVP